MQSIFGFPDAVVEMPGYGKGECVVEVVAVDLDDYYAQPVRESEGCVLAEGETIPAFGKGFLEEDGG